MILDIWAKHGNHNHLFPYFVFNIPIDGKYYML